MKNKNTQKPKIKLTFVPYLALRAKLIAMNSAELSDYIDNLFETNPFVEEGRVIPSAEINKDYYGTENEEDMYSFLIHQFRMLDTTDKEREIGEFLINSFNTEGYCNISLGKVAEKFNTRAEEVERILKKIQNISPPGIGARNLQECFILELEREEGKISPKIKHIIKNYLELLAREKYQEISKKTGINKDTLKELREKLIHLNPSPGLMFSKVRERVRIPDIVIENDGDSFNVYLNKAWRREIKINEEYKRMLKDVSNPETAKFLRNSFQKAEWSIKSIMARNKMLLDIGYFIAKNEYDFLKRKKLYPNKASIEEFCRALDSSPSIVSRLIQNKYVSTPRGIYPLHFFVQRKNVPYNDEELKEKIREIIRLEDPKNPLSDIDIANKLSDMGIKIKRRTVAKYRNMLHIPPRSKRRLD